MGKLVPLYNPDDYTTCVCGKVVHMDLTSMDEGGEDWCEGCLKEATEPCKCKSPIAVINDEHVWCENCFQPIV